MSRDTKRVRSAARSPSCRSLKDAADYILTTHADAPPHDVVFLQHPDLHLNELGARGIGEIGLAGISAAITSAIHRATGVRVRELPVRVEDLLRSQAI